MASSTAASATSTASASLCPPPTDAAAHQHARLRAVVQRRTWAAWGRAAAATAQPSEAVRALRSTCAAVGIPASHRPQLWLCLSGAADLVRHRAALVCRPRAAARPLGEARVKERFFFFFLRRARDARRGARFARLERQIDLDLGRTFPEHAEFSEGGGAGQAMLRRVLLAHCRRNPQLGYTQSLNFLAAMLLIAVPPDGVSTPLPAHEHRRRRAGAGGAAASRRRRAAAREPGDARAGGRPRPPPHVALALGAVGDGSARGGGGGGGDRRRRRLRRRRPPRRRRAAHLTREEAAFWLLCELTEELKHSKRSKRSTSSACRSTSPSSTGIASAHLSGAPRKPSTSALRHSARLSVRLRAFVGALPTETTFAGLGPPVIVHARPASAVPPLDGAPHARGEAPRTRRRRGDPCSANIAPTPGSRARAERRGGSTPTPTRRTAVELRALPPQTLRRMRGPHRERIALRPAARRRHRGGPSRRARPLRAADAERRVRRATAAEPRGGCGARGAAAASERWRGRLARAAGRGPRWPSAATVGGAAGHRGARRAVDAARGRLR